MHNIACSNAKGLEQTLVAMWTCKHELKHVHILTKVWAQMRGDWDMHMGPLMGAHVCMQLCKGSGRDVRSWVDMHTCSDACTHSKQDVG